MAVEFTINGRRCELRGRCIDAAALVPARPRAAHRHQVRLWHRRLRRLHRARRRRRRCAPASRRWRPSPASASPRSKAWRRADGSTRCSAPGSRRTCLNAATARRGRSWRRSICSSARRTRATRTSTRITNLCRCGTYPRIRKAIARAATLMKEEARVMSAVLSRRTFLQVSSTALGGLLVGRALVGACARRPRPGGARRLRARGAGRTHRHRRARLRNRTGREDLAPDADRGRARCGVVAGRGGTTALWPGGEPGTAGDSRRSTGRRARAAAPAFPTDSRNCARPARRRAGCSSRQPRKSGHGREPALDARGSRCCTPTDARSTYAELAPRGCEAHSAERSPAPQEADGVSHHRSSRCASRMLATSSRAARLRDRCAPSPARSSR